MNIYQKKHVCNVTTGEIELVDLTPEEVEQRDQEREEYAIEEAKPKPKSKIEILEDTIADLAQQVAELKKKAK